MNTTLILNFLKAVAANNNREWFHQHKDEYEAAKAEFESGVAEAISTIAKFDSTIAHLTPKDCCYRFYRDTRFSPDKSPYKHHFGAYIAAHGKKALHGGYYIHLQPDHCMLAIGNYWLPTNILTAMRNEIMGNIDEWRRCVESKDFIKYFGRPQSSLWEGDIPTTEKGFGIAHLKKMPKDFPKDYEFPDYLKMKDYCAWTAVNNDFFSKDNWKEAMARIFKTGKPMMDFANSVIDDYE